jgi:hypothetical protein
LSILPEAPPEKEIACGWSSRKDPFLSARGTESMHSNRSDRSRIGRIVATRDVDSADGGCEIAEQEQDEWFMRRLSERAW